MADKGVALGFDFGLARIGVAVGASEFSTTQGLEVVPNRSGRIDWRAIDRLVRTWGPKVLVLGEPQERKDPRMVTALRTFREELGRRYSLPVEMVNEDYTSACARAELREQRRQGERGKVRREEIDMMSASLILRTWFS